MSEDQSPTGFETDEFDRYAEFEMSSDEPGKVVGDIEGPTGPHVLRYDEPEPMGDGEYASPVTQMFGSLIACQMSVLNQCLQKSRIEDYEITAEATIDKSGQDDIPVEMPENTAKRVEHISIRLDLSVPEEHESRAQRCLEVYDEGCIVGQSFRAGIDYTTDTELTVE